jgi:hypothetical protein
MHMPLLALQVINSDPDQLLLIWLTVQVQLGTVSNALRAVSRISLISTGLSRQP